MNKCVLAIEFMCNTLVRVDYIEDEISVVLQSRCEDHDLVRLRHHLDELLSKWTQKELTTVLKLDM